MEIYVGNLTHTMTASQVEELFSVFGRVRNVRIITDHYTRQSKNFGYVNMPIHEDGCNALAALDGQQVNDRALVVKEARSRDQRQGCGW